MSRYLRFLLCCALGAAATAKADIYVRESAEIVELSDAPADGYSLLLATDATPGKTTARMPDASASVIRRREQYTPLIAAVAREQGVEAALLHAVVTVESGYNPQAVSRKGAVGLMQLMPATAMRYGVASPGNPTDNLNGGARLLKDLIARYRGDLALVLAAYNAGEGAVDHAGNRVPRFAETRNYVPAVLSRYHALRLAAGLVRTD